MRSPVFLLILAVIFLFAYTVGAVLPMSGESDLYDKVIRLHVLANSDSDEDQNLKLKVRDEVLFAMGDKLSCEMSREDAESVIAEELDNIKIAADEEKTL